MRKVKNKICKPDSSDLNEIDAHFIEECQKFHNLITEFLEINLSMHNFAGGAVLDAFFKHAISIALQIGVSKKDMLNACSDLFDDFKNNPELMKNEYGYK